MYRKIAAILAGLVVCAALVSFGALRRYQSEGRALVSEEVPGVAPGQEQPKLCLGYDEAERRFGPAQGMCPLNYAFYGVDDPAGPKSPSQVISVRNTCCPLPAADILTDEHVYSHSACPPDHVGTGSRWSGEINEIRCTRINTARYQLGSPEEALYWGDGAAGWQQSRWIDWEQIPAGIRYAQGRRSADEWDVDGCIGYPWGSLLTEKHFKYCSGFRFRQLQYAGAPGDPPQGTPVLMFPKCKDVANSSDPQAAVCQQ